MLTTQDIRIVKSTVPLLEAGGTAITDHFYQRMFNHNPELQDIFNMSNQHTGRQKLALFEAIAAYAKNIDNIAVLKHAVERIANKHTSFHIQPKDYDIVGHHLIETLRELLPEQFTEEVESAWTKAYGVLANVFIDREEQLYQDRENSKGGWRGKRAFAVVDKIQESELVTSFVFEPVDQQAVMDYQPGQYIGIELKPNTSNHIEIRQYSLSTAANGKQYRISVKREQGQIQGLMSNYLHDHIQVGDLLDLHPPAGDFFFIDKQQPVVLISAGVGVTPMQAMLDTLAAQGYQQQVSYLHACENAQQHSFNSHTQSICQQHGWQHFTWYNQDVPAGDTLGENIATGFMDFSQVSLPLSQGDFYLCGPLGFMEFAKQQLLNLGVSEERIHYEVFGPHANL
ncbi:NO-inducible flavohemoprotein [Thalassotalea sp. HSM 43]|uniref:NO-inducible flavohemoprotein n=1 Tax=Thalassotalea sp. HSM 43 TaxID=2552945 RepID=UPI001081D6CC|nr:NO-inducible flavohemoprotein [Thalassotalea sp. HSM 43]QBY05349.1 NO-inducible flavohemoprotein [Thalassotalea sp. HSM 43]